MLRGMGFDEGDAECERILTRSRRSDTPGSESEQKSRETESFPPERSTPRPPSSVQSTRETRSKIRPLQPTRLSLNTPRLGHAGGKRQACCANALYPSWLMNYIPAGNRQTTGGPLAGGLFSGNCVGFSLRRTAGLHLRACRIQIGL